MQRALADTSVFIGLEAARFDAAQFAGFEWGVMPGVEVIKL